jgi:carbamate kinase
MSQAPARQQEAIDTDEDRGCPGGNALLERGQSPDADIQEAHVASAVAALAPLLEHDQLIITHGNGPQVGVLAAESAVDAGNAGTTVTR